MANLNTLSQDRDDMSQHDQIKLGYSNMIQSATKIEGVFQALKGRSNAESQDILDAEKATFISQMKTALGL